MIYIKLSVALQGLLFFVTISLQAQISSEVLWKQISAKNDISKTHNDTELHYQLDHLGLAKKITNAPFKNSSTSVGKKNAHTFISFPNLQGNFSTYRILKLRTMSPELYNKYPNIHSFIGIDIENPLYSIRFTMDKQGFNGKVVDHNGIYYIRQLPKVRDVYHVTTITDKPPEGIAFKCGTKPPKAQSTQKRTKIKQKKAKPKELLVFRLAVATTGEYAQYHIQKANLAGDASNQEKKTVVLAAINKTFTRINEVFEKELSVTFQLVANNDKIVFLDPETDPFTNSNIDQLIKESQEVIDDTIGFNNYDLGHTLGVSDNIDGLAEINAICQTTKAKGVTKYNTPEGKFFDVDIVAHEIGHQFGANHTQNNDCARASGSAVEPGSGSTIMSYAGICVPNVQSEVDPYFNAKSLQEIFNGNVSTASDCGITIKTINNSPPTAPALQNYTIPHSTPFVLDTDGSDPDSDTLTYCWEQQDNEIAVMPPESNATGGPLFRSLPPTNVSKRFFPPFSEVLNGNSGTTWEVLPTVSRNMNFSVTIRDNNSLGGMSVIKNTVIKVAETGPFQITSQNTSGTVYDQKSIQQITWDVAGTNGTGMNVEHVKILLSYDNGKTFDTVLFENSDNDGEELVEIPEKKGCTQCRIKIVPTNNIFYAVNSNTFEISDIVIAPKINNGTIKIFPNPNNGRFIISFGRSTSKKSPIAVQVFNIAGKLMFDKIYNGAFRTTLDFKEYATGVYIVRVVRNNEVINKKLIIK